MPAAQETTTSTSKDRPSQGSEGLENNLFEYMVFGDANSDDSIVFTEEEIGSYANKARIIMENPTQQPYDEIVASQDVQTSSSATASQEDAPTQSEA